MSTVKRSPDSRLNRSTSSEISSSVVPASSRRWIASARMTVPPETLSRVDHGDALVARRLHGEPRALDRPGELSGQEYAEDPLEAGELRERALEVGGRRLRGLRLHRGALEPAVELVGRDVDVVAKRLVAEVDEQRYEAPVRVARGRIRQVRGRVEDERGGARRERHLRQHRGSRRRCHRLRCPS